MIKGDTADSIKSTQIVLVRVVESMPGDNIEWSVILFGFKQIACELAVDRPLCILVVLYIGRDW